MSILSYQIGQAGLDGVKPRVIYIETNDTLAGVTAPGYLNTLVEKFQVQLQESDMALVSTKTTPSAASTQVAWLEVNKSGNNWSLTPIVIEQSHVVKFAGQHTTVGGNAAEAITVNGADATDLAFVQLVDAGSNTVSVVQADVTTDTLTVTFSANPGNDAVINYQLLRAV